VKNSLFGNAIQQTNLGGIIIHWNRWLTISSLLVMLSMGNALTIASYVSGDKHLFIEIWEHQDGKVTSGTAHRLMIDFPTYELENSTLKSMIPFAADPLAIAILGQGSSLSGDMGGGAASGLSSIKVVPYQVSYHMPYPIGNYSSLNISITQIEGENVTFDLSGRQMVLEPGESWKRETSEVRQIQDSLMKVTTTLTIWNHGKVILEAQNKGQDSQELI
jgi:hypothetical protein